MPGIGLPDLDLLLGGGRKVVAGILDGANALSASIQSNEGTVRLAGGSRSLREPTHAIPAMGRRQYLHVVLSGREQNHPPIVGMHRVVDAVLRLVDCQEPALATGQGHGDAEQADGAIAKTSQRNGSGMVPQLDDRTTPDLSFRVCLGSDHGNSIHLVAEDQLQCLDGQILVARQGDSVPGLRDLAVGQQSRSQGYARHFEQGILGIVATGRQILERPPILELSRAVCVQGHVSRTDALFAPKPDLEQRTRSARQEVGIVFRQFRRPGITGVRSFDLDAVEITRSD